MRSHDQFTEVLILIRYKKMFYLFTYLENLFSWLLEAEVEFKYEEGANHPHNEEHVEDWSIVLTAAS